MRAIVNASSSATDGLPEGWAHTVLSDFVYLAGRIGWRGLKADEYTKAGPLFISVHSLNQGEHVDFSLANHISQERFKESPEIMLQENDVLLTKDGAGIGKLGIVVGLNEPATINSSLLLVRASEALVPKFLYYLLRGPAMQELVKSRITGSTTPHLFQKDIKLFEVQIPPLAEQRRIVAKVEELLTRVNAARERLAKAPTILKRFRQSVLAAACSGQLTSDWRSIESEPWYECKLGELIIDGPQNGLYKPRSDYGTGTPIVRIADFYDGVIRSWASLEKLKTSAAERELFGLSNDDFLINRVNSMVYLGKSALVRSLQEPCVFESNMMRFRIDSKKILPEFLIRYLSSLRGLEELRQNAKHAINQSSINQQDVAAVRCPLPPMTEQHEIVRRVKSFLLLADKIESRVQAATARVEKITEAILAKAFRGELVPTEAELARQEGRDYEPASELLDRIRASRVIPAPDVPKQRKSAAGNGKSSSVKPSKKVAKAGKGR
ncbi:MAG: restriction endonuclease subunit S [Planctomycetes bacterium]|nr:restriction endonuclease subunit S [Planctomycetota bacterium]